MKRGEEGRKRDSVAVCLAIGFELFLYYLVFAISNFFFLSLSYSNKETSYFRLK